MSAKRRSPAEKIKEESQEVIDVSESQYIQVPRHKSTKRCQRLRKQHSSLKKRMDETTNLGARSGRKQDKKGSSEKKKSFSLFIQSHVFGNKRVCHSRIVYSDSATLFPAVVFVGSWNLRVLLRLEPHPVGFLP